MNKMYDLFNKSIITIYFTPSPTYALCLYAEVISSDDTSGDTGGRGGDVELSLIVELAILAFDFGSNMCFSSFSTISTH